MTISLSEFLAQLAANPVLAVTVALTLGVVLVNGWTDAPNAIATCVSTRAMSARSAILMAAVFNFLGVLVMTMVNASVAATIYNMVDFGGNTADALTALCAALVAIVAWATAAWWFGIPTSESHALIAWTRPSGRAGGGRKRNGSAAFWKKARAGASMCRTARAAKRRWASRLPSSSSWRRSSRIRTISGWPRRG